MNGAVSARGASPQLSPQNWGNQYSMKMHHEEGGLPPPWCGEGGLPSPWCEHCPRSYGSLTLSRGRNTGALKVVIITGSPRQHGVAPPPRTEIAPKKDLPFLFEIAAVAICPEMKKTRFVEGMHRRAQKCAQPHSFPQTTCAVSKHTYTCARKRNGLLFGLDVRNPSGGRSGSNGARTTCSPTLKDAVATH